MTVWRRCSAGFGTWTPVRTRSETLERCPKGDTPLNPRFKGVSPLWTPQNGERPVFLAGVIRTLESAAPFNFVPFNYVQGKQDKPFSGRGRKDVEGGFRFSPE